MGLDQLLVPMQSSASVAGSYAVECNNELHFLPAQVHQKIPTRIKIES